MISVTSVVKEILDNSPFLKDTFSLGIVNLSALAKILQPQIEKKLLKKVSLGSIIVALSRIEKRLKLQKRDLVEEIKKAFGGKIDFTLRTNLVEYNFPVNLISQEKLFQFLKQKREEFLMVSKGNFELTVLLDEKSEPYLRKVAKGSLLINKLKNLAAVSIRLPEKVLRLPGVYYFFLFLLTFKGINVIEIFSTFRELNIVIDLKDVIKVIEILKSSIFEPWE